MIVVGQRSIGEGSPAFVAAEVGINHNGDMGLAHKLIDAAADAGADGVKFQNYATEDFVADPTITYSYVSRGATVTESQHDLFTRCELGSDDLSALADHAVERGLTFFSTPTSEEGVAAVIAAGARILKNGSDFLGHLPLVAAMARSGLPTILSTGMATIAEIDDAVRTFHDAGGTDLVLLHCTSTYPTDPADVRLRRIPALHTLFGCPVGFSDHTAGTAAAIGAVALGACVIEKHFTLDKDLPGPDHRFSADPAELRALVDGIRVVEHALGDASLGPALSELEGRRDFRLSCVAARDLPSGHRVGAADVVFRRPGSGLPPKARGVVVGRELVRPVSAGHVFIAEDWGG